MKDHAHEGAELAKLLREKLPHRLDGRVAILEMRDGGSRNWRQMEWIGWWFEHFAEKALPGNSGFITGPKYGNVVFDLQKKFVWDLKAHPDEAGARVPLNDQEAVRLAILNHGGLGYVIVRGSAHYDDDSHAFRIWHDAIKGKKSKYQIKNAELGKPNRRRKTKFHPDGIQIIWLPDLNSIEEGMRDGWLLTFQKGMINSNGGTSKS